MSNPHFEFLFRTDGSVPDSDCLRARSHQSAGGISDVAERTARIVQTIHAFDPTVKFKFAPHTYYDVEAFSALCRHLPERIKRNTLKCLETFSQFSDLAATQAAYRNARLAITGRFHSAAFALLYTGNFLPIYKFPRAVAQLDALGLADHPLATPERALRAYRFPEELKSKISACQDPLRTNRERTRKFLHETTDARPVL